MSVRSRISEFFKTLIRPHALGDQLDISYAALAADEVEETEALEWAEATIRDLPDEPW